MDPDDESSNDSYSSTVSMASQGHTDTVVAVQPPPSFPPPTPATKIPAFLTGPPPPLITTTPRYPPPLPPLPPPPSAVAAAVEDDLYAGIDSTPGDAPAASNNVKPGPGTDAQYDEMNQGPKDSGFQLNNITNAIKILISGERRKSEMPDTKDVEFSASVSMTTTEITVHASDSDSSDDYSAEEGDTAAVAAKNSNLSSYKSINRTITTQSVGSSSSRGSFSGAGKVSLHDRLGSPVMNDRLGSPMKPSEHSVLMEPDVSLFGVPPPGVTPLQTHRPPPDMHRPMPPDAGPSDGKGFNVLMQRLGDAVNEAISGPETVHPNQFPPGGGLLRPPHHHRFPPPTMPRGGPSIRFPQGDTNLRPRGPPPMMGGNYRMRGGAPGSGWINRGGRGGNFRGRGGGGGYLPGRGWRGGRGGQW